MTQIYRPLKYASSYQANGTERMLESDLLNAFEQGLGKTKVAYDAIGAAIARQEIDLAVIITRASLVSNTLREIGSDATQLVALGAVGPKSVRQNLYRFPRCHVIVISYDTVKRDLEELIELFRLNRIALALDESHYTANPGAQRSQVCLELSKLAYRKMLFSGTPRPKSDDDLFMQLKILGYDVGANLKEYRKHFVHTGRLASFLEPIILRKQKQDIEELKLPPKNIRIVPVRLAKQQQELYCKLRDDLVVEIRERSTKERVTVEGILPLLLRLLQMASNPRLVLPSYKEEPAKFLVLDGLVNEACSKGEKVIVWTHFRGNVEELCQRYARFGTVSHFGGLRARERAKNLEAFKTNPDCRVLVATPQATREGFTFVEARIAIYVERSFSTLDWLQSQDRIHRLGQTRECEIIVLQGESTVDMHVHDLLTGKVVAQHNLLRDKHQSAETCMAIEDLLALI